MLHKLAHTFALRPGAGDAGGAESGGSRRAAFDLVADATGRPEVIADGLERVKRGGTFLVFGVAPAQAEVPMRPYAVYYNDLTIVGSMAINGTFGAAVRMAPTLALGPLLAAPRGLEAYAQAIAAFGGGTHPKQQLIPTGP